jgi:putative transcriptional regulator
MAADKHQLDLMDGATDRQITVRQLGDKALSTTEPISSHEIRALRKRANLSQAAFARYLNLSAGYVSQWERGIKQPTGSALPLLNMIRRKGFEMML